MDKKKRSIRFWRKAVMWAAIATICIIGIVKCSHSNDSPFAREFVKSSGDTLDIAIEMNPTIYSLVGDSIIGTDYQMLRKISKDHGVPMKFHPFVPLAQALDMLDAGQYDMVVASLPLTPDLKNRFLMTNPIYLNREILVQLKDSVTGEGSIRTQVQLAGDTLWIAADSPFADRIENLSAEIGDTIYIQSDPDYSAEHLFILVAKGLIRNAVVNESIAKAMAKDYPNVDISTPISFTQFQSWAVTKQKPELLDSLNAWLTKKSAH